ncbi:hypothetical protein [Nitrosopumilus sp.]|uniref:hypothetical protein n=1 Tax=Nitrosopumilus sp. TaxID=2024843 RepID=UPI00292D2B44|nr:hypothetical protein [Nitrosopumilus sp.]
MKKNSQNQQQASVDKRIKDILLYKKKIHKNSTCCTILQMMYPDAKLTARQITRHMNKKPHSYTKKIISQMQSDSFLFDDGKKYNRTYCLSSIGRWFAVCIKLDYLSFQSLCVLALVYDKTKRYPQNTESFYMLSNFRNFFDKSYNDEMSCASAIYTNSNIIRSINQLTYKNLAYRTRFDFLKITPVTFEFLYKKYDSELISLAKWCSIVSEKCRKEHLDNLKVDPQTKHLMRSGLVFSA